MIAKSRMCLCVCACVCCSRCMCLSLTHSFLQSLCTAKTHNKTPIPSTPPLPSIASFIHLFENVFNESKTKSKTGGLLLFWSIFEAIYKISSLLSFPPPLSFLLAFPLFIYLPFLKCITSSTTRPFLKSETLSSYYSHHGCFGMSS